jgi:uncharacterized RDD family membrane protein YckC
MEGAMKCPKCGLINRETALRCDCGLDFPSGTMMESYIRCELVPFGNLATLGQRLVGQLLDSLVAFAAIIVGLLPIAISQRLGGITLIFGLVFAFFYILFADGFKGGQSYGKRITKTAVIDATTGTPCTFAKSFVRNLLLSLLGIIDWAFIFGRKRQRLGDKAANTLVVKSCPIVLR